MQIMCLSICLISSDLGPTKEYICDDKKPRGHEDKYDCNTLPFIINKRCLVYSFGEDQIYNIVPV